jgi:ribonuclease BN (tRNA processing enzyme)
MKLTVIGCSGSFPGPDSPASSYLVEHEGYRLLLDLGSGALGALQRHVDLLDINAIVLSHLHSDHFLDLCPYVVYRRYHPAGPAQRIPLLGPAGTHDRVAMAYDPAARSRLRDVFDVSKVVAEERELGPFRLRFERVNHPVEAYATRVEAAGRSLVYSGDTGASEALVELARGADVLLCEASFVDGPDLPPNLHLTGREAGEHASKAEVRRLLVTHIPPWTDAEQVRDEAAAAFAADTELVAPDAEYEV